DALSRTFGRELAVHRAQAMIAALPLYLQMQPLLYNTCRSYGVPLSVVSHHNLPLAAHVAKEIGAEAVVVIDADAAAFEEELHRIGYHEVLLWHTIAPLTHTPSFLPRRGVVYREQHVFPGVVIFYQDESIRGSLTFRISDDYLAEVAGNTMRLTSRSPSVLPLMRYEVPFTGEYSGTTVRYVAP
ncbi:MAG: hypothetical protein AAB923_02965, partial [Patescibacteria group bacterium]